MSYVLAMDFLKEFIQQNPTLEDEARDMYQLFLDEVEDGGSIQHEYDLFVGACNDLKDE